MTEYIRLKDGTELPLPDNATDTDIQAAIAKHSGGTEQSPLYTPPAATGQETYSNTTGSGLPMVEAHARQPSPIAGAAGLKPGEPVSERYKKLQTYALGGGGGMTNPADPTGNFLQNLLHGYGETGVSTGRNMAQLYNELPSPIGNPARLKKLEEDEAEARRLNYPLMHTVGGMLGEVGGEVAQNAIPLGGVNKLAQIKKLGMLPRALAMGGSNATMAGLTTPVAPGESRDKTMGWAAIGGGALAAPGVAKTAIETAVTGNPGRVVRALGKVIGKGGPAGESSIQREAGRQIEHATKGVSVPSLPLLRDLRQVRGVSPELDNKLNQVLRNSKGPVIRNPGGSRIQTYKDMTGTEVHELRRDLLKEIREANARGARGTSTTGSGFTTGATDQARQIVDKHLLNAAEKTPKIGFVEAVTKRLPTRSRAKALREAFTQYRTDTRPWSLAESARQGWVQGATVPNIPEAMRWMELDPRYQEGQ